MIHEVTGDILLTHAQTIAHGVAPNDHFDQGLALSLRERWPAMVKDFRHYCQMTHAKSGGAWVWVGADGKRIINLLTQDAATHAGGKPGRATTGHVNHALRELRRIIKGEEVTSLAMPRLATGVGGLEWSVVRPLIDNHLGNLNLPIYIYTQYEKARPASEPGLE